MVRLSTRDDENVTREQYKILLVDDDPCISEIVGKALRRVGHRQISEVKDPLEAIELVRKEHYDIILLDYIMYPIHGDVVVTEIRKFDKDVYILLLTGYKDIAPPIDTLNDLDIQGYCEKSDDLNQLLLLVESGIKSVEMLKTIKRFRDGLNKILLTVPKIYQLQSINNIMEEILLGLMSFVKSKNAFILVDDINLGKQESIFQGIGNFNVDIEHFMKMLDPAFFEHIGQARVTKSIVQLDDGVVLPLINEYKNTIGAIFIQATKLKDSLEILEIYSSQAASSLSNAFLHSLVNIKNEELNKTYEELRVRYMDTIEALRMTVDAKDIYTRGHSDRVAYYAVRIGKEFGCTEHELELLRTSGIFHDVGKIGTADDILFKDSELSPGEYDQIKKHPLKGAHILSAVAMFKDIVPLVKNHHERIDGKGYPRGLKGEEIPMLARILSVADSFDAMTSNRKYRAKLTIEDAKEQLRRGAGMQFDAKVVEAFLKLLDKHFDEMQKDVEYTYEDNYSQSLSF